MPVTVNRFVETFVLFGLLGCVLIGQCQPAGAQSADISSGRRRAEVCMACHGENGVSKTPGIPSLAGQDRDYLAKALQAYRGGQLRQDPTMAEMAKPLTDADIVNLAAFWNNLGQTRRP